MKNIFTPLSLVLTGLFLISLLGFSSRGLAQENINLSNDVGATIETPALNAPIPGGCVINHAFDSGALPISAGIISTSLGTQMGRLHRSGFATTCAGGAIFDTYNTSLTYKFESYTFKAESTGCLNVNVTNTPANSTELYMAVYSGLYNPLNYIANGVGQAGSSGDYPFACPVVGGKTYTVVIMESDQNGAGVEYSITMDNVSEPTPVPFKTWYLVIAFAAIAIGIVIKKRFF